jgi:hypothetical protein
MELVIKTIKVVQKSAMIPAMRNSGKAASAAQTIDISITRLNKFKVKMRRGSARIFNIGAIAKFNKAMANPATANISHPPEYDTSGMRRAANAKANALPMVYIANLANIIYSP